MSFPSSDMPRVARVEHGSQLMTVLLAAMALLVVGIAVGLLRSRSSDAKVKQLEERRADTAATVKAATTGKQATTAADTAVAAPPPPSPPAAASEDGRVLSFSMRFYGITSVDIARRTVYMDLAFKLRWRAKSGEVLGSWVPEYRLQNIEGEVAVSDTAVERVQPVGGGCGGGGGGAQRADFSDTQLYVKLGATLWQNFDLTCFPFDQQTFLVALRIPRHRRQGVSELVVAPFDAVCFQKGFRNHTSCHLDAPVARVEHQHSYQYAHGAPPEEMAANEAAKRSPCGAVPYNRKPTAVVAIRATRESYYWVVNVGLPLFIMVVIAFDVFMMAPTDHAERVALIVTSMLTVVSFKTTVEGRLPELSYPTLLDKWIVFLFLLLFAMAVEAVVVFVVLKRGKSEGVAAAVGEGEAAAAASAAAAAAAVAAAIDRTTGIALGIVFVGYTAAVAFRPNAMAGPSWE